jgi:sugar phosphate isomerase/epimerase
MVRSAITACLVPELKGAPFVFWDDLETSCQQAAELGFDAIELFPADADSLVELKTGEVVARHGLKVSGVGTGVGFVKHRLSLTSGDAGTRAAGVRFIKSIIDRAADLGAPAVLGSMQGRFGDGVSKDQAITWLRDGLEVLGEHAATRGQVFLFEAINRYETNLCNRIQDVSDVINPLATKNIRILADLFHMNIEERDIGAALKLAGAKLGHVHYVDSNRRAAGAGHIDFAPVLLALRELNYQGYLSTEAIPVPDSMTAAKQAIDAFRQAQRVLRT